MLHVQLVQRLGWRGCRWARLQGEEVQLQLEKMRPSARASPMWQAHMLNIPDGPGLLQWQWRARPTWLGLCTTRRGTSPLLRGLSASSLAFISANFICRR